MPRSPLRSASRWLAGPTRPGWFALQLWLQLGLVVVLSLGGWVRPTTAPHVEEDEPGLHAGTSPHGDLTGRKCDAPLRGEAEDSKDSEDELHKRHSIGPLWLGPSIDFDLTAAIRGHRFADARHGGPGSSHSGELHNRGPPVA